MYKKGLRNSRTEVPTPEAGALLSGLITVPTSTRGICVRAYTLRGEERRKEKKREKKEREREEVTKERVGRKRGEGERCNIARRGLFYTCALCTHTRERHSVTCNTQVRRTLLSACKARFYVRSNAEPAGFVRKSQSSYMHASQSRENCHNDDISQRKADVVVQIRPMNRYPTYIYDKGLYFLYIVYICREKYLYQLSRLITSTKDSIIRMC